MRFDAVGIHSDIEGQAVGDYDQPAPFQFNVMAGVAHERQVIYSQTVPRANTKRLEVFPSFMVFSR
jgi:hypothetical protein